MFSPLINICSRATRRFLIFCIEGIRPMLGPDACRFEITCSKYAVCQLESPKPLLTIVWLIIKRVGSCHPLMPRK